MGVVVSGAAGCMHGQVLGWMIANQLCQHAHYVLLASSLGIASSPYHVCLSSNTVSTPADKYLHPPSSMGACRCDNLTYTHRHQSKPARAASHTGP
jgi:hypothetical protein